MTNDGTFARLTGPVYVGVDHSSGGDWYCEATFNRETGVWTILDSYQLPRSEPPQ